MAPHVKSKRIEARKKYKVAKKVRAHHRKLRKADKEAAKKGGRRKDPGIPNSWPFKQELMEQIKKKREDDKQRRQEELQKRREEEKSRKRSLKSLVKSAERRGSEFDRGSDDEGDEQIKDRGIVNEGSRKAYMRDLKKVVESADVILEVLDARDPLGCRCLEAERALMEAGGGTKRLVLVLNKVDLVPKEITQKWLAYLRNDFPTVAFRAALQGQRNVSQAKMSAIHANEVHSSEAFGADTLLQLLKNYSRSRDVKTATTVGVIGYPNVGKSSLINSLKRSRAVTVGASPGVTKSIQEVHIDKHIRLIDCPGIVFSTSQNEALVLRNCIKIENLTDPVSPVEVIIKRCGATTLMSAFGIPEFSDVSECLAMVAKKRGKVLKGGVLDLQAAARTILQDWNGGKVAFFTTPPKGPKASRVSAAIVSSWGKDFDINSLVSDEAKRLELSLPAMSAAQKAEFASAEATELEEMTDFNPFAAKHAEAESAEEDVNREDDSNDDEEMEDDNDEEGSSSGFGAIVASAKKRKVGADEEKSTNPINVKLNPQVNRDRKKDLKKRQRGQQRVSHAMVVEGRSDDAYDFSVLDNDNRMED